MRIGLSPQSLFFSPHSIFISLQTCFNFASFSVAPSLSLSLFPFSSCHICSILRFPLYFLVSLARTSPPSLSLFLSSFFLLRHLHCSLSQSFCDSLMYFSRLFRFNIPLFPHPVIFFFTPGSALLQRQSACAAFKDEDARHIHSHPDTFLNISSYLAAHLVPR